MKKGDVCLFYTRAADGVGRGYHWAGIVDSTRQSPELSESIWGTRDFELVYFLSSRWPVTLPKQDINKALAYNDDYAPQGLMRANVADQRIDQILALLNVPVAKPEQLAVAEEHSTQMPPTDSPLELTERIARFCAARGYQFLRSTIRGLYASLRAKPFVILAGNSGTGKSRLARLFAEAVGANTGNRQFQMISVRPDWNDSSDLLGYFDLSGDYRPGLLITILLRADAERDKPFFVCLDEMNLARVEHYFSDFLSIIESRRRENGTVVTDSVIREEHIQKMKRDSLPSDVGVILDSLQHSPHTIGLPPNLYVLGTVNMDETTQPFSRKVLDRANTLEFNEIDLNEGLTNDGQKTPVPPLRLRSDFLSSEFTSLNDVPAEHRETAAKVAAFLQNLNISLGLAGFEVGYRVRDEAIAFTIYALGAGMSQEEAQENIVLQKVLPRVQGSSPRIETALISLMKRLAGDEEVPDKEATDFTMRLEQLRVRPDASPVLRKLAGMLLIFREEGFTSFWLA
jgi:energy-coupling factor transporter ATP-binding protein EcfA2